jgi:signal transduction histidine kinase/CheY-like chemotaxis protein
VAIQASHQSFLAGGGEMGAHLRARDWAETSLGPLSGWPQSLRSAVSIMLNSRYPIALYWGPELALLYNDAWSSIPGAKHPAALGKPAREVWPEIWDNIGPLFAQVLTTGEGVWQEDELLPMLRHGYVEECYFNFTFSPVRGEDGTIQGIFNAVVETTDRVLSERRLQTLSQMGGRADPSLSVKSACGWALDILAQNLADVPFALVYLRDGEVARLAASTLGGRQPADAPTTVSLTPSQTGEPEAGLWPFSAFADLDAIQSAPASRELALQSAYWSEPVAEVVVAPILTAGESRPSAFLVAGANPRLRVDDRYRSFFALAAGHIGTAIMAARAYDDERRRADALAQIDAAKTVFFSNVSHEFRTPLALMLAPLKDLLDQPAGGTLGEHRDTLGVVHRNAQRLLKLVNALLDFSRLEAGRVQARYEPVELAGFTAELASNFRSATDAAGLQLTIDCPALDEPVYVDRDMWETIVLNLVSNAFKFTLEGGISVRVRRTGDEAELIVQDSGVGIPPQELPRLFDRFHRVEAARGRSFEGTGIGLALVEELVKLHGGVISVDSLENEGTSFTVRLPMGRSHLAGEKVAPGARTARPGERARVFAEEAQRWLPDGGGSVGGGVDDEIDMSAGLDDAAADATGVRILLADDNADMRAYLSRLLGSRGYRVEAAPDGEAALAAALREPPALVLSDVMMPKLSGLELLQALRQNEATREVPTLLLSARAGEDARIEALAAGADDYLLKPFSARELLARVSSAIRLAQARRDAELARKEEALRILQLFDGAPGFMCVLAGPRHVWEFANQGYRRLVGLDDPVGQAVLDALPEVAGQGFMEILDTVYSTGERFVGDAVPLSLGAGPARRQVWLDFIYEPVKSEAGETTGIFVVGMEVTDRVIADERQRVLVNELNHRVKNTLATVQSIAWQSLRRSQSVEEARGLIDDRLISLAHAHDLLTAGHWTGADLADVASRALGPFSSGTASRVAVAGPQVRLNPSQTLALSLAFHELATNAVKYGALSTSAGRVSVEWQAGDSASTVVVWREAGGPPVSPPTRPGFGSRLLQRSGADLGGSVDLRFEPAGVVCVIEVGSGQAAAPSAFGLAG